MPLTATLARVLKDLEFPANKNEIVEFVSIKPEYLSPKICQTMNNQSMILWLFYYTIYHTSSFIIELRLIVKTRSFPA
jgi:hypothetical protein